MPLYHDRAFSSPPDSQGSDMSRVSVVIPCYNAAPFIASTLESVLAQTLPCHEIIVVDDGSVDASADIVRRYAPAVTLLQQPNQGESSARNRGIESASGDWVAFLDADDLWLPEKTAKQLEALSRTPGAACSHTGLWFDRDGVRERVPEIDEVKRGDYSIETMLLHHMIPTSVAMVRRDVRARFALWTRDGEDLLYFADVTREGSVCYVPEPLAVYRKHGAGQSASPMNIVRNRQSCLEWLSRSEIQQGEVDRITRVLLDDLLSRMQMAKWKRMWPHYWALRDFLGSRPEVAASPLLRERIWPRALYSAWDTVVTLLGRT